MYKGSRDFYVMLKAPIDHCFEIELSNGKYIKVTVPNKNGEIDDNCKDIVVKPDQVYYDRMDEDFNVILVNAGAKISICTHAKRSDGTEFPIVDSTDRIAVETVYERFELYYRKSKYVDTVEKVVDIV